MKNKYAYLTLAAFAAALPARAGAQIFARRAPVTASAVSGAAGASLSATLPAAAPSPLVLSAAPAPALAAPAFSAAPVMALEAIPSAASAMSPAAAPEAAVNGARALTENAGMKTEGPTAAPEGAGAGAMFDGNDANFEKLSDLVFKLDELHLSYKPKLNVLKDAARTALYYRYAVEKPGQVGVGERIERYTGTAESLLSEFEQHLSRLRTPLREAKVTETNGNTQSSRTVERNVSGNRQGIIFNHPYSESETSSEYSTSHFNALQTGPALNSGMLNPSPYLLDRMEQQFAYTEGLLRRYMSQADKALQEFLTQYLALPAYDARDDQDLKQIKDKTRQSVAQAVKPAYEAPLPAPVFLNQK